MMRFPDLVLLSETKTWTKEKEVGDIPPPRGGHSAVAWNNYLFVFGGFNGRKYFNDLYSLDISAFLILNFYHLEFMSPK